MNDHDDTREASQRPALALRETTAHERPVTVTNMFQLRSLERRLDDGYRRIEGARQAGQDTADWEEFWIQLLHEYESIADDLALAA